MTLNVRIPLFCAVLALSSAAFADTAADIRAAQQQKAALQAEIKKLNADIQESDSLVREDAKRYALLQSRYNADIERRRADLDTLSGKLRGLMVQLQAESGRQSAYKGRIANDQGRRKALRKMLTELCVKFESQVKQTLPWDRDNRLSRVTALRRDLETGNGTEEEAFSRLSSLITEETRFGDEVQLVNAPVTRRNGEVVNARVLRIGNQWMVYADENNTIFGALVRTAGADSIAYAWNENLTLAEREAIRNALDVKQGRKPPQMVTLPLSVNVAGGKK